MTRDYSQFFPTTPTAAQALRPPSPLTALGWQPFFAQQTSVEEMAETPPCRVIAVHRNGLQVRGAEIETVVPTGPDATVGDWLLYDMARPGDSRVLARKSLIARRAPGQDRRRQMIAANLETAFVTSSCNADFNVARLERYIALALEADVAPVIVLTKADLAEDVTTYVDRAGAISDLVPVVALDARAGAPVDKLAAWCKLGQTVAFLGSSGVGKSTLTNALVVGADAPTQEIREDDAKGRHTTTRRQLHLVPGGCAVLDTPGMRELQLADVAAGVEALFSDLEALADQCRFNDCAHETEPGCAVSAAVARGEVDAARLARWRKLAAEDRFNAATLAERRSRDRAFGKMVRRI
ncbi:MAG: ribosome small subunit-dependent GTPase A, partial [Pseudomonadota bacterium]